MIRLICVICVICVIRVMPVGPGPRVGARGRLPYRGTGQAVRGNDSLVGLDSICRGMT